MAVPKVTLKILKPFWVQQFNSYSNTYTLFLDSKAKLYKVGDEVKPGDPIDKIFFEFELKVGNFVGKAKKARYDDEATFYFKIPKSGVLAGITEWATSARLLQRLVDKKWIEIQVDW